MLKFKWSFFKDMNSLVYPFFSFLTIFLLWEFGIKYIGIPEYLIPKPTEVISNIFLNFKHFSLNAFYTLFESVVGFLLGSILGMLLAILILFNRNLERILLPLAILIKVTPIIAYAPLLVIWFGFGVLPKIIISALIVFFPVLINAINGLKLVDQDTKDFFDSISASNFEMLIKLRMPNSLPYVFAAFRITLPMAIVGATIGEYFSGGDKGLGSLIFVANYGLDLDTLFSCALILAVISIILILCLNYIEKKMVRWTFLDYS